MNEEAQIILSDTIEFCKRDGQDQRLVSMLEQSHAQDLTDSSLSLEAPTRFAYSYLLKQRPIIERYFQEITFSPLSLNLVAPQATPIENPAPSTPVSKSTATATPGPIDHIPLSPHTSDQGGVEIQNTMDSDTYKRVMQQLQGRPYTRPQVLKTEPKAGAPSDPVPLNSKFTFENFVYGEENKHAYVSAVRFVAHVEDPGDCNFLFIYGKSGLGKTHLLLAIANDLRVNKPYIRVKYANSNAYLDDVMAGFNKQKNTGEKILRDYHAADVLIIDDIQNIVGKQASVEYFFQLIDEFIRENKKVVIASDRAPKDLAMDERMTSRFNSGMLCLVSAPGFEMKYTILKRYYETNILAANEDHGFDSLLQENNLLNSVKYGVGELNDQQLRHMAEVSGTNIRDLESFCEKCASISWDRQQEGEELSLDDIDQIANQYFDLHRKKITVGTVQSVVEEFYRVSHEDLIGSRRHKPIAFARHVAIYLCVEMCDMTTTMAGREFGGRDHSTVINSIKVVEKNIKEDRHFKEDLLQLRNKIRLRS